MHFSGEKQMNPSVSDLRLAAPEWTLEEKNQDEYVFVSTVGDIVGVEFRTEEIIFALDFNDLGALRTNIRQGFGGAGLISADVVELAGTGAAEKRKAVGKAPLKAVSIITKLPQIPSGRAYNGLIFLPFQNCSYSLYMRYEEGGDTGLREAALADKFLLEGEITLSEENGRIQGFEEDLYDPLQRGPLVRNKAEREIYDAQFPNHPLTRLRACIVRVLSNLIIDDGLLALDQPGQASEN